jgi:hypothetical protein
MLTFWRKRRWDSSDPDRAPPPLPLYPGSGSPVAHKNASANVTAAAEAIAARARQNMFIAQSIQASSPEKSLMKGQFHKRLTSIQPGAVKDLSTYLENAKSPDKSKSPDKFPDKSPERPSPTKRASADLDRRSPDRTLALPSSPTPTSRGTPRELSRPSSRRELKPILGETPPQSATMKALTATPASEPDRGSKNGADNALVRAPQNFEAISNQILGLTSIATRLQQEMAALSRRSKDNATDLVSLREATHSRDEDIRKTLRDLVTNLQQDLKQAGSNHSLGKDTASPIPKSISLPRMPSQASFSSGIDRDLGGSPGPYSTDGAAAIALLEKVLREMATKEGQEQLMASVSEMASKDGKPQSESRLTKQLEEVIGLLKDHAMNSRALVRTSFPSHPPPSMDNRQSQPHYGSVPNSPHGGPLARSSRNITPRGPPPMSGPGDGNRPHPGPRPGDFVNDEIFKILKRMKDSIAEGGGMSAEIKSLLRDVRGEVLGMGRDIAKKLDHADGSREGKDGSLDKHQMSQIVRDGLSELKTHLEQTSRDMRRRSSSSVVSRATVDSREIHNAVKNALRDFQPHQREGSGSGIEREEILEAVREAWETYKPEIEMQNFGLERDEILQCLKEGLEDYRQKHTSGGSGTYEEILEAVRDGLKDFKAPAAAQSESSITREEIVMIMRESLETFEISNSTSNQSRQLDALREDVLDAVRAGMSQPQRKEVEFNREDLFDAVLAGIEKAPGAMDGIGQQVIERMQDLMDAMRTELQSGNGQDSEQVVNAMKDNLETLRARIETYVDRAADVTGKDEIIETIRTGMDNLRVDLEASIANGPRGSPQANNNELLDAMEKEFEHLRSTISLSVSRGAEGSIGGREELFDAIRDGFDELKGKVTTRDVDGASSSRDSGTVLEELQHLRTTLATTLTKSAGGVDREEILDIIREGIDKAQIGLSKNKDRPESIMSNSSELIEIFNDSLDNLKTDIERIVNKPIDMTVNYEILDTLKEGLSNVRNDLDILRTQRPRADTESTKRGGEVIIADEETARAHTSNLEKLEVMMTQLKMKVEALDGSHPSSNSTSKTDIDRLGLALKETQGLLSEVLEKTRTQQDTQASKEDTDAIETLLRNTKAIVEDMNPGEGMVRAHHIEGLETMMREAKEVVDDLNSKHEAETASKADLALLEVLIKDLQSNVHEIREQSTDELISKDDFESLANMCTETQNLLKAIAPDSDNLPSKTDFANLQEVIEDFQETVNSNARLQAQAFDARKTEHGGIADKIEDTKAFLEAIRAELKGAVQSNHDGIEGLNVALSAIGEAVTGGDLVSTIKGLKDNIEAGFEKAHSNQDAARGDLEAAHKTLFEKHDEHKAGVIAELTNKIDERFDELMTKYDDAQNAAGRKEEAFESKASEQTDAISSTRAVAEDLKILIDTLGNTVTETCERMTEDNKTVYNRVDDIGNKMEETVQLLGPESKADHQLTRAELSKSLLAVESMKSDLSEWNPKMMGAISDILRIVGEHYDHACKSTEEIKSSVDAIPGAIPTPALPAPQETVSSKPSVSPFEKYDDTAIHAKLDQLVESVKSASDTSMHLSAMKDIEEQITFAAIGLKSFVETQRATAGDSKDHRSREADNIAIAIEKRNAQKDAVETEIVRLTDERAALTTSIESLKREQKELAGQKSKMQADVKSLETALRIRREEMEHMESRAESLERRVIEGVLDHSRSLLLSSRPGSSLKSMNLKRVSSTTSSTATVTTSKTSNVSKAPPPVSGSALSSAVGMALKKRQPTAPSAGTSPVQRGNRRILSLSAAGGNRSSGVDRSLVLANTSNLGSKVNSPLSGSGMKRSHSVKSNLPSRKSSWSGANGVSVYDDDVEDKENSLLEEVEEDGSEGATDRRTSFTGTFTSTEDSYAMESMNARCRTRSRSYAGSNVESVRDEDGENGPESTRELSNEAIVGGQMDEGDIKEVVLFSAPDSALGTDPPTAALESEGVLFAE